MTDRRQARLADTASLARTTFSISGVVRDVCPKDGYSAYVTIDYYANGLR